MADAAQRQRRLAAKAARRKAIVAEKKKLDPSSLGLAGRVRLAATFPIARCVMPAGLFDIGIGHVILARALPQGIVSCGFFLVDVFCLGVKDAFIRDFEKDELEHRLETDPDQEFVEVDPPSARKLIRDAVAYAAGLGLAPAPNYNALEPIFGEVDAGACGRTFTFGKDGRPFYITGPNDTPARIRLITETLDKKCGSGNWNYMIGGPG
jgi:hypothetical protein